MTISYNWLLEYLPEKVDPERLSLILTSIGLEVESLEKKESVPGGLKGLVVGAVLETHIHPNADKLRLTQVDIGTSEPLSIVCGAPNVEVGQKVIVAPIGTTIFPVSGEPITMKKAKIRGEESHGMICAEDEIGLGNNHAGILVLKPEATPGTPAADYFQLKSDWIYEIGLTPNRMDAMSHLGVARDVIAYINYHDKKNLQVCNPLAKEITFGNKPSPISIEILNTDSCKRYAGICIEGIKIQESPEWLKQRLISIGLKPINNVVDVTNFLQHESGQPLHAFDRSAIKGNRIIIRSAEKGEQLQTLDLKTRTLHPEDLLICNESEPMCLAGVFGGADSGVKNSTTGLFIESAWFDPKTIRKTSFRHQLRTDAATRFEKGVDISLTIPVLLRAATLIQEVAGGIINEFCLDVYPNPVTQKIIRLPFSYLEKISGKMYPEEAVKKILSSLGFEIRESSKDAITVAVPFSKPDIHHPVDLVEEIMRIDGLDHVEIPTRITLSPSSEKEDPAAASRQKAAAFLSGNGFLEILTNSITNHQWYTEEQLKNSVRLLNNLSADHTMMRPSMIESGLECVAFNLHRKNLDLQLFEFGKIYHQTNPDSFSEKQRLTLWLSGNLPASWNQKSRELDLFYAKGLCITLLKQLGIAKGLKSESSGNKLIFGTHRETLFELFPVPVDRLKHFDIRQDVIVADFDWEACVRASGDAKWKFEEPARFPVVERDLSIVVDKQISYHQVESAVGSAKLKKLNALSLFDVFEHERFGPDKKSMALHFEFLDPEKTLTDTETDGMMQQLMKSLEKNLNAEIRK